MAAPVAGLLLWTLVEYLIHRFAFHGFAPHYRHHADPTDPRYIVAPLWLSLAGAAAVWILAAIATGSWSRAALVVAGLLSGYLAYELVHLRIHSADPGGSLLRALRRYHYYHHFADEHACYGVTSPVWDRVFHTCRTSPSRATSA